MSTQPPESPVVESAPPAPDADSEAPLAEKAKPKIDPTKDLWSNISINVKDAMVESSDQTVIVCGASQSGKTSIIQRMLKGAADDKPKPTTALDYSYGKREDRSTTQIVHFWELAHDTDLAQLSDVVVTAETIHQTMAIIVVDCADPASAFSQVTFWLKKLDSRVQEIFEKMRAKSSGTPDKLLMRARKRIGDGHPDLAKMRVLGIPITIIASRLDKLTTDTVKAKLMVKSLRFLAHLYGASLIFTSQLEREANKMRALLNHLIFEAAFDLKLVQRDNEKGGVLILAGQDLFSEIQDPNPVTPPPSFVPSNDATLDRWKAPFEDAFPPKTAEKSREDESFKVKLYDVAKGFGEPAVDQMRKLKDSELEQYRRTAAKKSAESRKEGGDA